MASIPSPPNSIFLFNVKSLFAVLHCKATNIYTAFVAATIDFLFLNSLNKSQTGQLVWMSPLSLLPSAFLTYASSSQAFWLNCHLLTFPFFSLIGVMFCSTSVAGIAWSVSKAQRLKKKKEKNSIQFGLKKQLWQLQHNKQQNMLPTSCFSGYQRPH